MTSPHALFLSLAATICAFALALVAIVSHASRLGHPRGGNGHGPQHRRGRRPGDQPRRLRRLDGRLGARREPLSVTTA